MQSLKKKKQQSHPVYSGVCENLASFPGLGMRLVKTMLSEIPMLPLSGQYDLAIGSEYVNRQKHYSKILPELIIFTAVCSPDDSSIYRSYRSSHSLLL